MTHLLAIGADPARPRRAWRLHSRRDCLRLACRHAGLGERVAITHAGATEVREPWEAHQELHGGRSGSHKP